MFIKMLVSSTFIMDIDFILLLKYSKQTEHIIIPTDYSPERKHFISDSFLPLRTSPKGLLVWFSSLLESSVYS